VDDRDAPGFRAVLALARHELRLLLADGRSLILLFTLPLAIIAFFRPALELTLFAEGYVHADGSAQAVPGIAVTFSLFLIGYVGLSFFRDHGWGTWDRLHVVPLHRWQVLAGKVTPLLLLAWAQLAVLFGLGFAVFNLSTRGSLPALAVLSVALAAVPVAGGLALVASARTVQQVNVVANLGAIVVAGLGGALVPLSFLPDMVRAVAPASPAYWAMSGFRAVILDGEGLGAVVLPVAVLTLWSAVLSLVAVTRYRFEEQKVSWA
jgi:ABC-2 type transport system permease protein